MAVRDSKGRFVKGSGSKRDPIAGSNVFEAHVLQAVEQVAREIGADIAAQGRLRAPVDTTLLRSSIFEDQQVVLDKSTGTATMGVSAQTPYALIQHEREDFIHPRGGEAKYLTKPAMDRREKHLALLHKRLTEALRASRS